MRINNNMMAMNTHRQLGAANAGGAKSMEKLSSGMRINRAGDDAAGLSISEKMRGQIRGLNQASSNAQDGISLIQTAEGALNETHAILQRMRELSVQSATDTNTDEDRIEIQEEINQLATEVTRISTDTEFNTRKLLNGKIGGDNDTITFHIGANKEQNTELAISNMASDQLNVGNEYALDGSDLMKNGEVFGGVGTDAGEYKFVEKGDLLWTDNSEAVNAEVSGYYKLGATPATDEATLEFKIDKVLSDGADPIMAGIDVTTQDTADTAIETINSAITTVSAERSKLGAMQNRLEHTIKNLDTSSENLQASEARIRDVDMAKEMMEQTRQNILAQASTAMLAQANQAPQSVLQLLG